MDDISPGIVGIVGHPNRCPYCKLPMFGIGMMPHRAFQCEQCEHIEQAVTSGEPFISAPPFDCECNGCEEKYRGQPRKRRRGR